MLFDLPELASCGRGCPTLLELCLLSLCCWPLYLFQPGHEPLYIKRTRRIIINKKCSITLSYNTTCILESKHINSINSSIILTFYCSYQSNSLSCIFFIFIVTKLPYNLPFVEQLRHSTFEASHFLPYK